MALQLQPRLAQKQTATPMMMMGFSLLQLPVGELREAVKKELESNPALEVERDYKAGRANSSFAGDGDKEGFLENVADNRGETLDEHILSELRMRPDITPRQLCLAQAIAENLDGDGRFTGAYPDILMVLSGEGLKDVKPEELEAARQLVMTIDPKGCGARDLAECYRAQLGAVPPARRQAVDKAIGELATALASGKVAAFRPSDPEAFLRLKKLDPYPGRLYDHAKTVYITPDVYVDAKGEVRVDQSDIPEICVSAKYIEMAKDRELDEETRAFAAERVKRAREFREALMHRQETIEKIAECVVDRQRDFLREGAAALRKLTMVEVAREAKCTVSTVSRAAARKFVKTPRGTIPLRRFFARGDAAPIEALRELLSSQPDGARASDRVLAEEMTKKGFPMARRTVAKYRVQLGY